MDRGNLVREYFDNATNINKSLFIRNTGKYILNLIMKISNISLEIDVNNESTMTEEVNISLNKLFNFLGQEFGNIISKHMLNINHTMS